MPEKEAYLNGNSSEGSDLPLLRFEALPIAAFVFVVAKWELTFSLHLYPGLSQLFMKKYLWVPVVAFLGFSAAAQNTPSNGKQQAPRFQPEPYHPESQALHDTIATLDSIYFNTYNTCNLALMDTLMAEDMEF